MQQVQLFYQFNDLNKKGAIYYNPEILQSIVQQAADNPNIFIGDKLSIKLKCEEGQQVGVINKLGVTQDGRGLVFIVDFDDLFLATVLKNKLEQSLKLIPYTLCTVEVINNVLSATTASLSNIVCEI